MAREDTTFYETPRDDPRDLIEVEIGDSKQPEFFPQIKMMRHGNEGNLSVRLIDHGEDFTPQEREGRVVCEGQKINLDLYTIPPNEKHPEGASEFEITLLENPLITNPVDGNVMKFSINTKGLQFDRQPELSEEQRAAGWQQEERSIGSYAGYYTDEKINVEGGNQYRNGKAFHWWRPRIEDAKGAWVWGELNIDANAGRASVTIPVEFLETATYPVRHAAGATIGYTSVGSFGILFSNNQLYRFGTFTATGTTGPLQSISFHCASSYSSKNYKLAVYDSGDALVAQTAEASTISSGWNTHNTSTNPDLNNGSSYGLAAWLHSGGNISDMISFDVAGSDGYGQKTESYNSSFPSPLTGMSSLSGIRISMYATYGSASTANANFMPFIM